MIPDWVRDVLRVVLLFAIPLTVLAAALYTFAIASFGEPAYPEQIHLALALWLSDVTLGFGLWALRRRR